MTVTARKIENRDVYEVDYDQDAVQGASIKATFSNPEDKSVYAGLNDGTFIVSVAVGHEGEDEVVVEGSEGGQDTGTVAFG